MKREDVWTMLPWRMDVSRPTRRKMVLMSPELLQGMLTTGWHVGKDRAIECIDGLPEGARFITAYYDYIRQVIALIFEHPDWPEIVPYSEPPIIMPTFRAQYRTGGD